MPRTESDVLAKAPLSVTLGEKKYAIKILTILPARAWRLKLDESVRSIVENFQPRPTADAKEMATGLTGALIQFPEKICDLLFAYAPNLPKEEILGTEDKPGSATEEQIAAAFAQVMGVAYPFLAPLALVTQATRANLAARASSTTLQ